MGYRSPSGNRLHVTILTNTPQDAELIQRTLAHVYPGASVEACPDEKTVAARKPSVSIVDTASISGSRLEHLLDQTPDIPSILLMNDFAEVRHFSHHLTGQRAVITRRDIEGMGLIQAIHHLLERQQLREQLQRTSHHLKEVSIRDELTRLFNHHHMDEILVTEIKKANRYRRPLGLVIVAIKNFTAINESFGHHEGDRILARAAEMIRGTIREVDIPARYGDNEFAIILPESDEAAATIVGRRIQEALSGISIPTGDKDVKLATGCGIAAISPLIQTKDELIHTALGALLEAKKNGHNAICTSGDVSAKRHRTVENRKFVEQISTKFVTLATDTEKNFFQSIMKTFSEIPAFKRSLLAHSERVAFFAQRLSESVGLSEHDSRSIHRAGMLHDAGKLAFDTMIMDKPASLSPAEYELMKQHPALAIQMIGRPAFFTVEPDAILHHHERYDGTGYPEGIAGETIPLAARILAIAEAWDTMISAQPYRAEPMKLDLAIEEIKKGRGTQFDPMLSDRFTGLITG